MTPTITWQDTVGWFDWMDLYDEVALTTPPYSTVVEVGVAFGRSLLYLAQKIKETGKQIQVVAVDRWTAYPELHFVWNKQDAASLPESERVAYEYAERHNGIYPAFLYNLYHSGLAPLVRVISADSAEASRLFIDKPPHFVFIDAEHTYEAVKRDIDSWWDTKPEWMAGHDYNRGSEIHFPGVWKAVDEKFGNGDVENNIEWRGQTCWVVRRSHLERPK